jgi:hypothetical protein
MAKPFEAYHYVIVESFWMANNSGHRGNVHVRPIPGQIFEPKYLLEGPKEMVDTSRYPIGTRFRVRAKLTDRKGKGEFLWMHHTWPFPVVHQLA